MSQVGRVLFPTITFAIFFLVVYAASWLLMPRLRAWKLFMVAAGYLFYGWWDWRLVLLLVGATAADQLLGMRIASERGQECAFLLPRCGQFILREERRVHSRVDREALLSEDLRHPARDAWVGPQ